ncbi:MAG: cytochrome c [candidate division KSB1 bacterium]|nr:cytochrome c [candidate division KSB1 bacterium]MDZ7369090.1 cytochrome c [candidate division KSB1 bacterium]MDZ7407072.1 cytochrome c [candidate division KSB1 bacterium]
MPRPLVVLAIVILAYKCCWSQAISLKELNGKLLYEDDAGCASCHGVNGKGENDEVKLDPPPPDFTDCGFNTREPRKDWHAVIKNGGVARGLSRSMPSYSEALTDAQIDVIIDYLKTFCAENGWPPGELNFRRPQITVKAFPENEALLIPTYTHRRNKSAVTKFVYEKRLGRRAQWEVAAPLVREWRNPAASGVGDIELSAKYVLWHRLESLVIFSGGVETVLPAGKTAIGIGDDSWKLAPYFAAAKGFDPFFLQSSVKYETPLKKTEGEAGLFFNLAFTLPLTQEKKGLFPMLELNGVRTFETKETSWFVTPQLYLGLVKRGHIAVSLGGQIPVAGARPFDYRLMSFLLWEYADGGLWW